VTEVPPDAGDGTDASKLMEVTRDCSSAQAGADSAMIETAVQSQRRRGDVFVLNPSRRRDARDIKV